MSGGNVAWTISASDQDPFATSTTLPTSSISTVHLWLACAYYFPEGITAAEFSIVTTPNLLHLATTPVNGFLNAGTVSDLLLAVGGCPVGPVVAADLLVLAVTDTPATMCIGVSSNGNKVVVDCDPQPHLWDFSWTGLAVNGADPCSKGSLCFVVGLEEKSWGSIKALYR